MKVWIWTARTLLLTLLVALAPLACPLLAAEETSSKAEASAAGAIDINRAGVAELQSIKGIGPSLAKRIVDHRKQEGPFSKIEDLLAVKGVGPKLLDRIRSRVVVKAPPKKKP